MKIIKTLWCALPCAVLPLSAQEEPAPSSPAPPVLEWSQPDPIRLAGPHARHQVVISARQDNSPPFDVTHEVRFRSEPEGIVQIDSTGLVRTLSDGTATITAVFKGVESSPRQVTVDRFAQTIPVSFPNEVVPILTRHGCNGGGCHGKAEGQNGFKLSLLGYEPWNDHEYLVMESRGRRIFRAAPEHSLFLLKGTGDLPHQGGSRLEKNGDDYQLLVRWIKQGLSYGPEEDPVVERIEVAPRESLSRPHAAQQLRVTAFFNDGSTRDVTRIAQYESKEEEMAEVDENGHVTLKDSPGSTSIMIRFQEHVDVFRATIPLGAPVDNLPEPVNLIDERIFAKLKTLGLPP
nr:S-layer protein [Akkermansiaceae bacterium]